MATWPNLQTNLSYVIKFCLWSQRQKLRLIIFISKNLKKAWNCQFCWHHQHCKDVYWKNFLRLKQDLKKRKLFIKMQSTIMDIMFWDFLILYQTFLSLQVKRSVIISNRHGIYELPKGGSECPHKKKKRLRILGNYERSGKSQNLIEL